MPKKVKPTAYVLINCDLDHKDEVIMDVSQLPGIIETADLDAAYDILVKLRVETVEELKETVKGYLRKMPHIRNTLVLVAIEPRGSYAEEE
ncbi:MAG TPA: Lrp/AsnC ligand binding domain-containing protein [Candidatus Bathyarchaeia archaeon]|nr:Lrp/AsnC ligand binding domain-containing protein [Candidatus Bathyarchaeia archaeon]